MKRKSLFFLLILCISTSIDAQVKKRIKYYELDVIRGLFFQPNTMGPYNGTAYDEHSNGKKRLEAPIKEGKLHGTVKEWAKNGQKVYETKYENGIQIEKEIQWYANGNKSLEIGLRNGKVEGMCLEWHKNGKRKSEGMFRNGLEEGEHNWWYDQGEKDQKATFVNGKMEGLTQNWHRNGQVKLETNYKEGKRDGAVKEYFTDGELKMEGHFVNDLEDGKHRFWSKKGFLLGEKEFDKGKLLREYNYRSGNIKTSDGYIQVFNKKESFYKINITANRINEVKDPINIIYAVDGMLLRIYDIPVNSLTTQAESPTDKLAAFVKEEIAFMQADTDFKLTATIKEGKTQAGIPFLYWYFQSPSSQDAEQKPRTTQSEHYISLLCKEQVLNLYSVVTNSDEPTKVEAMLRRIADQVRIETARMDLNALAKKVK